MAASQQVYAVVINWNGGDQNLTCLRALVGGGFDAQHVVFVDNASVDGSSQLAMKRFSGMEYIRNPSNLGFAEAANQGAERALSLGARWVFFINNDLELAPRALQVMLQKASVDKRIAALSPRILMPGNPPRIWAAAMRERFGPNVVQLIGHRKPDGPEFQTTKEVSHLTGAALLVRSEALRDVGLFEPSYFAYMEDVDLCARLGAAHWKILHVGEESAVHDASGSTGGGYSARRKYMLGLNTVLYLKRNGRLRHWFRFFVCDFLAWPLVFVASLPAGNGRGALAKALGLFHGFLGKRVRAKTVEPGGSWLW
ncbi:MAG: glycosyltransferase family 2 protein [Planctomycetota bacterium]|nr:glycosyltransferase family 2 protein [Planctomycetota bacterium]